MVCSWYVEIQLIFVCWSYSLQLGWIHFIIFGIFCIWSHFICEQRCLFISSSYLTAQVRTSSTVFSNNGEHRHLCFVHDFREERFQYIPAEYEGNYGFFKNAVILLRNFPSIHSFLSVFIIRGCRILPNALPTPGLLKWHQ